MTVKNREIEIRTVNVTRYIMPLREGGSLPALAEADDGFKYVVKFRGAGHGTKALIAELIGGEVARALKLRLPEIVFLNLDEAFGRSEGDEEIQDLLQGSRGLNLGLHFLSGALPFDPVVTRVDAKLASQVVWMDALLTNVDRTAKKYEYVDVAQRIVADRSWSIFVFPSFVGKLEEACAQSFYTDKGACLAGRSE